MPQITLYHGGRNLESDYLDFPNHRNGSWEYGPGLYLIKREEVARGYAKGGRTLYAVTINYDPNKSSDRMMMSPEQQKEFAKLFVKTAQRKDFLNLLEQRKARTGKQEVPASTLFTLGLNLEAIQSSKTGDMRRWLSDQGVTHTEESNYGGWGDDGQLFVVINPKIIKKIKKVIA